MFVFRKKSWPAAFRNNERYTVTAFFTGLSLRP